MELPSGLKGPQSAICGTVAESRHCCKLVPHTPVHFELQLQVSTRFARILVVLPNLIVLWLVWLCLRHAKCFLSVLLGHAIHHLPVMSGRCTCRTTFSLDSTGRPSLQPWQSPEALYHDAAAQPKLGGRLCLEQPLTCCAAHSHWLDIHHADEYCCLRADLSQTSWPHLPALQETVHQSPDLLITLQMIHWSLIDLLVVQWG